MAQKRRRFCRLAPKGAPKGAVDELAARSEDQDNDPMPGRSHERLQDLVTVIANIPGAHGEQALRFMEKVFRLACSRSFNSMRRWYSGQTMARGLLAQRDDLRSVMKIEPKDALGVYRGFKVDKDSKLAQLRPGDSTCIPVTRNHGFSSWSTTEAPTDRFSGKSKGKVGLVVKLIDSRGIQPVLAPPERLPDGSTRSTRRRSASCSGGPRGVPHCSAAHLRRDRTSERVMPMNPIDSEMLRKGGYIFFWGGWPSNWHPSRFVVDGVEYNCMEQFMMAEKARLFGDDLVLGKILASPYPKAQKEFGERFAATTTPAGRRSAPPSCSAARSKSTGRTTTSAACCSARPSRSSRRARTTPSGGSGWP